MKIGRKHEISYCALTVMRNYSCCRLSVCNKYDNSNDAQYLAIYKKIYRCI